MTHAERVASGYYPAHKTFARAVDRAKRHGNIIYLLDAPEDRPQWGWAIIWQDRVLPIRFATADEAFIIYWKLREKHHGRTRPTISSVVDALRRTQALRQQRFSMGQRDVAGEPT